MVEYANILYMGLQNRKKDVRIVDQVAGQTDVKKS